jgi:hypothetical protein
VLALKVDRKDLEKINELKSNKKDTEDLVDNINTLNKQVQHLILLLSESVKLSV